MRLICMSTWLGCVVIACGCGSGRPAPDVGILASTTQPGCVPDTLCPEDAGPDVADAGRVACSDTNGNPDASVPCARGQICGNSGGVVGSFCCYPTAGMPGYCPD